VGAVGLVLTGGGARGAYEAGALSVLLPELERRGERPSLLVGTSVGAINAAHLAASHHLPASEAVSGLVSIWRGVTLDDVIRPIVREQVPLAALRGLGGIFSTPGTRQPSLLDATPLGASLQRWGDWPALRRNIDSGTVALAVVATAVRTERTVVFCDAHAGPPPRGSHELDYVAAQITPTHIRAAAAIPLLFAPVRIGQPAAARGWYVDGGTRLNAPIKPALDLGVGRLAVVGTASVTQPEIPAGGHDGGPPGLREGALNLMHGALLDPLVEDLRALGNINAFFADGDPGAQRYRHARGKRAYRTVPYLFIGPRRPGAIGELAREVYRERYGGLRGARSPDFVLLNRLLGGSGPSEGELLSYLFFEPTFLDALIDLGRRDARGWLAESAGADGGAPWLIEPLPDIRETD
jgi:NTE family protein